MLSALTIIFEEFSTPPMLGTPTKLGTPMSVTGQAARLFGQAEREHVQTALMAWITT